MVSLRKDHVRLSISDGNQSAGMSPTEIICELPMELPCASVPSAFLVVLLQLLNQLGSHRSWQKAKEDVLIKLKRHISPRTFVFKKDVCRSRPWWAWTPVWENPDRLTKADLCFQIKVIFFWMGIPGFILTYCVVFCTKRVLLTVGFLLAGINIHNSK